MYEFSQKLWGDFEHTMSQGCWFVFVPIGIILVVDVTILAKYTILAMTVVVGPWIADY